MRCGPTRIRILQLRRSKDTSRSIPTGSMRLQSDEEIIMSPTIQEKNKALVLDAFETLFNKRDYAAAEKFWSPDYIQHSAHIEPGREGLFNLIRSAPDTLRYEHELIVAEGDYVIVHGRFSGHGPPAPRIAPGTLRYEHQLTVAEGD